VVPDSAWIEAQSALIGTLNAEVVGGRRQEEVVKANAEMTEDDISV